MVAAGSPLGPVFEVVGVPSASGFRAVGSSGAVLVSGIFGLVATLTSTVTALPEASARGCTASWRSPRASTNLSSVCFVRSSTYVVTCTRSVPTSQRKWRNSIEVPYAIPVYETCKQLQIWTMCVNLLPLVSLILSQLSNEENSATCEIKRCSPCQGTVLYPLPSQLPLQLLWQYRGRPDPPLWPQPPPPLPLSTIPLHPHSGVFALETGQGYYWSCLCVL